LFHLQKRPTRFEDDDFDAGKGKAVADDDDTVAGKGAEVRASSQSSKGVVSSLKRIRNAFLCVKRKEQRNRHIRFAKYTGVVRCSKQQQKKTLKNSLSKRERTEAGRIPRSR